MATASITDTHLSVAWLTAAKRLTARGVKSLDPLVVTITGFPDGIPQESLAVRRLIDKELASVHRRENRTGRPLTCQTVAGTIFPNSLWNPGAERRELYGRYLRILKRLKSYPANRRGLYFERLIRFGSGPEDGNQLEHMIRSFEGGVKRVSAFQASLSDPDRDFTRMPLQGFPCLQQVAVHPSRTDGTLAITGFYATQYLFSRAYGNYLGLCRLGRFLAHEMGLDLTRMTCVASHAPLEHGMKKRAARQLVTAAESVLQKHATPGGHPDRREAS